MNTKRNILIVLALLLFVTTCTPPSSPEGGISEVLAKQRKQLLSEISYSLYFSIPRKAEAPIPSNVEITCNLQSKERLVLDFNASDSSLLSVTVNERPVDAKINNQHIVIPRRYLKRGANRIDISFLAGKASLNRKSDFLYTLLVPDRASGVFPCFDQPDLKGQFTLTLQTPKDWVAVSNSTLEETIETDTSKIFLFGKTLPISTYLFAFATGKFDTISQTRNGRTITLYHRENHPDKLKNNLDAIFSAHFHALSWLKRYTGIGYPFGKLDIVLIPDFQYGGMEHPGAIYYRASKLFLDRSPSINQQLSRANLIAHEVSHQWFGNLVTMKWFNDVWLKEVFAGLMADKIVNPQFPDVNHRLKFLLSHYPKAYDIDRTNGANPIRQPLKNLRLAGTLYGNIIYHKAPIALMQLELSMGKSSFRKGLRQYLKRFAYGNADWNDLIAILDSLSNYNLAAWSRKWIESSGMPIVTAHLHHDSLILTQKEHHLPMAYSVTTCGSNRITIPIEHRKTTTRCLIPQAAAKQPNLCFVLNSNGLGYGYFPPDSILLHKITNGKPDTLEPTARASCYIATNEHFLNGNIPPTRYLEFITDNLSSENEPQIRSYLRNRLERVWWQFLTPKQRQTRSVNIEKTLLRLLNNPSIPVDERKPLFGTFCRTFLSENSFQTLYDIWESELSPFGLTLSETDYTLLAYELAMRAPAKAHLILNRQETRITNPDKLAKFQFVREAVSPDTPKRIQFFNRLKIAENRRPEPWVAQGLHYFFHPLRADFSTAYLKEALDLLPEIRETGDIFFPQAWLNATLWAQSSPQAAAIVTQWLKDHSDLSDNLLNKLHQASDKLFRAANRRKPGKTTLIVINTEQSNELEVICSIINSKIVFFI